MLSIAHQNSRALSLLCALLLLVTLLTGAACRSSNTTESDTAAAAGLVVVNSPARGEVRRVIASEDVPVGEGAVIVEIAVWQEIPDASPQTPAGDTQARARAAAQSMQAQIASARAAAERASVEVERVTALVASGDAPQPQLDAARVQYQKAQEQLQKVQQSASSAPIPQLPQNNRAQDDAMTQTREQIIAVRAPAAGTVRAIGVRAGQQVTTGQPLATIRTHER
jgi:multidrug resistance efflux pump